MIKIKNLTYSYKTFKRNSEKYGAIKDFFSRKYEYHAVFKNINIEIKKGEIVGLLGTNGAGKTTLLKIISGLLYTKVPIDVFGYNPYKKENNFLKNIGVLFGQKSALMWDLPAIDTLKILKEIYEVGDKDFNTRVESYVKQMKVEEKLYIPVRKLSLGERMKFEILAAIIHNPKLLLLDEPTLGLDLKSQLEIHEIIKGLKHQGITVILTSHYVKDIENTCDKVIVLANKKVVFNDKITNLQQSENISVKVKKDRDENFEKSLTVNYSYTNGHYKLNVPMNKEKEVISQLLDFTQLENIEIERNSLENLLLKIYETADGARKYEKV